MYACAPYPGPRIHRAALGIAAGAVVDTDIVVALPSAAAVAVETGAHLVHVDQTTPLQIHHPSHCLYPRRRSLP